MTQSLNIILPIALVVMAFLLKLFMDQCATIPLVIRSLYEVPVTVVFLALSFTTAFTIAVPKNTATGLIHLFCFFIMALIIVVLWRRSMMLFEAEQGFWSAVLFVLNGTLSGLVLFESITLIATQVKL